MPNTHQVKQFIYFGVGVYAGVEFGVYDFRS